MLSVLLDEQPTRTDFAGPTTSGMHDTLKPSVERLYDRFYPVLEDGFRLRNGSKAFYQWIRSEPGLASARALNVGAGSTPEPGLRRLRGEVGHHVGVDIDPVVMTNADLDEAYVTDGVSLPFVDGAFDFVYSDWTVEHIDKPIPFLMEIRRVLKPGGRFLFRTTNRTHYVTLVSAHTPHWFHRMTANRLRALDSRARGPWPTFYRMNTRSAVRRNLAEAGFYQIELRLMEPDPRYLTFSPLAFRLGVMYERLANRWDWSSRFRLILVACARARGRSDPHSAGKDLR
jgi:SAM-dependent methyltransferase